MDAVEHTTAFVLEAPPYAAIHLGAEGQLGGEGADRVAGFWRAVGLAPPAEPDHLAALLGLYARLGEEADASTGDERDRLARVRRVLFDEHLWTWVPGFAIAVTELGLPAVSQWATILSTVMTAEAGGSAGRAGTDPVELPLALRSAPAAWAGGDNIDELLDVMVAPLRSGMVLSRASLLRAARDTGTGYRIGERRFALRAMMDQDPAGTLAWLAAEARRWAGIHLITRPPDRVSRWWSERATATATAAENLLGQPVATDGTVTPAALGHHH